MCMGITYEGEIGRVGAGKDPQKAVELICTDPRFVEIASAKKPNFIIRLFNGALSFPRDWWYCAVFLSTRLGLFGADGKSATDCTARRCIDILKTAVNNPSFAFSTIRIVLGHLLHYPELYGRQGAMLATGIAISALGASTPVALGAAVVNFIMANTGAVIRAVDQGASSLAEVVIAAAIGESDPAIRERVAKELSFTPKDGNYDIPSEDEEYMLYVLKGVLHCLRNPGEYLRGSERPSNPTVPVGTVSSMRPRGVMGSIPVGYETNALDVIGDQNALLRRN